MRIVAPASQKDAANHPASTVSEVMIGLTSYAMLFLALGLSLGLSPSAVAVPVDAGAATDATLSGETVTRSDGPAPSLALDRDTNADRANVNGQVISAQHGNQVQVHSISMKKAVRLQVPEGGHTAVMLGIALVCLSKLRSKFKS